MKDFQLDTPLQFFVKQIRERLGDHLKQIILFGSRARGDNDPDSDYDCLILVDEVTSQIKSIIYDIGGDTLYRYSILINSIPVSKKRFEQRDYNPLFTEAAREGIIL